MEQGKDSKAIELRSGKELLVPYQNQKLEVIDNEGSLDLEKGNKDRWVEVQKPMSNPELAKYVPKLSYSRQ